ncbi:hypothetical protein GCM10023185_04820 [Hymenobacter saemangeumensis]|uniref:T9SS type A sorting domain-containing protein n=2 Tax=Hymenobacter saemangeumensis TaxID=1084522 RepID=A0ABP8I0H1_9BACT
MVLMADGTLRPGANGAFDATSFTMSTAPDGRPVFRPTGVTGAGDYKWQSGFGLPEGVNGNVKAVAQAGTNVYIGGNFTAAGNTVANYVAKWDGNTWSSLGTGAQNGVDGFVHALAVAPNGDLYVGGLFTRAGGLVANSIARWNGTAWSTLGTGPQNGVSSNSYVYALAVAANGDLYVGGSFAQAGGLAANALAKWNGTTWSRVGTSGFSMGGAVKALAIVPGGDLYVAGSFSQAGGLAANNIARWNGSAWSALGAGIRNQNGIGGLINALAIDTNGVVYVGGDFNQAGTLAANHVAQWNGTVWSPLGAGATARVAALALTTGGEVLVSGDYVQVGPLGPNNIARWDGTAWSSLGNVTFVYALLRSSTGDIYVGGAFGSVSGTSAHGLARWNGATWSAIGMGVGQGMFYHVSAVAVAANGDVYVGGQFDQAGGTVAAGVAKWDGTGWSPLGTGAANGVYGYVRALAIAPTGEVYVGGSFTRAGGQLANHVAKWNGTAWSALGTGAQNGVRSNGVYALAIAPSGDLYVGGNFSEAGPVLANNVAKWDGTNWSPLGSGTSIVSALALAPSGDLYAVSDNNIAKWNGSSWATLGGFSGGEGRTLAVAGNGHVYVGGFFTQVGSMPANGLAKWNGTAWSTLGTGASNGVLVPGGGRAGVIALAQSSTGELFVGGAFQQAGGAAVSNVASWNGSAWTSPALGSGLNSFVQALALLPGNRLCAGGLFTGVGDGSKASVGFGIYDPAAIPTAVAAPIVVPALHIYPNPACGLTTLQLVPARSGRAGRVLDALGRVVLSFRVPAGAASVVLDVPDLPAGTYIVRVEEAQVRLVVE